MTFTAVTENSIPQRRYKMLCLLQIYIKAAQFLATANKVTEGTYLQELRESYQLLGLLSSTF